MELIATFEEWKKHGYVVRFGQKAKFKNLENKPLFTRSQVALLSQGWQPLIEDPEKVQ